MAHYDDVYEITEHDIKQEENLIKRTENTIKALKKDLEYPLYTCTGKLIRDEIYKLTNNVRGAQRRLENFKSQVNK